MRAEVGLVSEGFGADGTLEGLFAYRKIKLHITFFFKLKRITHQCVFGCVLEAAMVAKIVFRNEDTRNPDCEF